MTFSLIPTLRLTRAVLPVLVWCPTPLGRTHGECGRRTLRGQGLGQQLGHSRSVVRYQDFQVLQIPRTARQLAPSQQYWTGQTRAERLRTTFTWTEHLGPMCQSA